MASLDLEHNGITDKGIKDIINGLLNNEESKLVALNVYGNSLKNEGASALLTAMARVKVVSQQKILDQKFY